MGVEIKLLVAPEVAGAATPAAAGAAVGCEAGWAVVTGRGVLEGCDTARLRGRIAAFHGWDDQELDHEQKCPDEPHDGHGHRGKHAQHLTTAWSWLFGR